VNTSTLDRFAAARAVADAVLYEGYVLYPYRASSGKNQVRWQFGVLAPRSYCDEEGSERWALHTDCLVEGVPDSTVTIRIRCLQLQHRAVEAVLWGRAGPVDAASEDGASVTFVPTDRLEIGGTTYVTWDEAIERTVDLAPLPLAAIEQHPFTRAFRFGGGHQMESLYWRDGTVGGRVVRSFEPVDGSVRVGVTSAGGRLFKISLDVENTTLWARPEARRDEALACSLLATHVMAAVDGGTFISMLDPPKYATRAVETCRHDGAFPVLVGDDTLVLAAPIVLYDHPEVAPESPGDLYDATEIDEILALRVLTLTDEEKAEARATDVRAAAIVDRCEDLSSEVWERLHGGIRTPGGGDGAHSRASDAGDASDVGPDGYDAGSCAPWWDPEVDALADPWTGSVVVGGVEVRKGSRVRLRPSHRADAQDLFVDGLDATVAGVFSDVDGNEHVAVTIDDDPAGAEFSTQGRYLFFHPDEVEPRDGGL
jgi:hypothetical protein